MDLQILQDKQLFKGKGFLAKKRDNHIEVWSADGEKYLGNAPLNFTIKQIEKTVRFHDVRDGNRNHTTNSLKN